MKTSVQLFRVLMMLILPLSTVQSVLAQEYLTFRSIYNYDIGDEFHYQNISRDGFYAELEYYECLNITIASKHFSSGNDTVFYTENYSASRILWDGSLWDTTMVRQVFYVGLDGTTHDKWSYFAYPNHSNPDYCNGRIYNSVSIDPGGSFGADSYMFVQGLGETERHYERGGQGDYTYLRNKLVYYKKGTEEWGQRYPVSVSNPDLNVSSIRLYPNPAGDFTRITRADLGNAFLKIIDFQGRTVKTEFIEGQITDLNTSLLKPGFYIVTISGNNKTESTRLIIQR